MLPPKKYSEGFGFLRIIKYREKNMTLVGLDRKYPLLGISQYQQWEFDFHDGLRPIYQSGFWCYNFGRRKINVKS